MVRRLVYYSLAWSDLEPRHDMLWQLELSVRSLRSFNSSIPIWVFAYGDVPRDAMDRLAQLGVAIKWKPPYQERLAALAPRGWTVLAQYPILHKFLNFADIAAVNPDQVLLLDCDTLFFGDVVSLFTRHATRDCYAREDLGARRSPFNYPPEYVDEELLEEIARREGVRVPPPFSCGLVLFNNRVWRRLQHLEKLLISYAWRLVLGMALHPLPASSPFAEGRGVQFLRRHFHRLAGADAASALPYPSTNRWLLEQVALWLVLGHVADLTYGDVELRDMQYFREFLLHRRLGSNWTVCHYGSRNTDSMAKWVVNCHRGKPPIGPAAPHKLARTLQKLVPAVPPQPEQPRRDHTSLASQYPSWPLQPSICPCDLHFLDYLHSRRLAGKTIFHFGTGEHHIVGRSNDAIPSNNILAITVSPREYEVYIDLAAADPAVAHHYKVLFADIYGLTPDLLPLFDLVTLFHLHEIQNRRDSAVVDDEGVLLMFCARLKPGGRLLFYRHSSGFSQTSHTLARLTKVGLLVKDEDFASLSVYSKASDG